MRQTGTAGARETRGVAQIRRPTEPRLDDGRAGVLRGMAIYVAFAALFLVGAYLFISHMMDERERRQIAADLRKAEQQRQGRVVHALQDGNCRMARFDNVSGRYVGSADTVPCDTPIKDPVTAAREFSWRGR